MTARRIALFGGTFDPIHNAHITLAREFARRARWDHVLVMPTFEPPHKLKPEMAPAIDRLTMCRLACEPYPELLVSDWEINRRGASFTVLTLERMAHEFPGAELFLLVGADMFLTLKTWHRFPDIAKLATLCAAPRGEVTAEQLEAYAEELRALGAACLIEPIQTQPVSSTAVRDCLKSGRSADEWLPPPVAAYLREHPLYSDAVTYRNTEEQYRDIIRGRLTPKRYLHSLAVAESAEHLARKYGADPDKARTAGLLHDILKDTDADSQLQILADFDILLDETEKQAPKLWHARSGAVFLEHILGITDPDILLPVRYHTTGRGGMTLQETVLYMADFVSADRDYPDVEVLRRLSEENLDHAMRYALEYTIADLKAAGRAVHPDTVACYRDILERTGDFHAG